VTVLLRLDNVSVSRDGVAVLRDVSLTLKAGERLALVGANGAGKSTLMRTIVGLQRPDGGTIEAFGRVRAKEADFHEVRLRAAYLFQDADDQLFCPTVIEDVAFGPLNIGLEEGQAYARARETLAAFGLSHLEERITRRLSGGEKRLVCLAGLMAMDPDILLLDEPTNSLDEANVAALIDILAGLDKTMIIVSHDRSALERIATRALLLQDGRLAPAVLHRHSHLHAHEHVHVHEADPANGA